VKEEIKEERKVQKTLPQRILPYRILTKTGEGELRYSKNNFLRYACWAEILLLIVIFASPAALADEALCPSAESCYQEALEVYQSVKAERAVDALARFRDLVSRFPDNPYQGPALYLTGKILVSQGDASAGAVLEEAIDRWEPIRDYILADLCGWMGRQGDLLRSAGCYDGLVEAYPNSLLKGDALWESAIRYDEAGEGDMAAERYRDFLQNVPGDERRGSAWFQLGVIAWGAGRYAEAGDDFIRVWRRYPSSREAKPSYDYLEEIRDGDLAPLRVDAGDYLQRARRLDDERHWVGAVKGYTSFLDLNGGTAGEREEVRFDVGRCYQLLREWDKAAGSYGDYLKRYPHGKYREEVLFRLGKVHLKRGKETAYLQARRKYLKRYPSGTWRGEVLYDLAHYYRDKGNEEKAVSYLDKILQGGGSGEWVSKARWEKGWWAYRRGGDAEAIREWESLSQTPGSGYAAQALYWEGKGYERMGIREKSGDAFRRLCDRHAHSYYCLVTGLVPVEAPSQEEDNETATDDAASLTPGLLHHPRYPKVEALIQVGMEREAARETRALWKTATKDRANRLSVATLMSRTGDYPHAIGLLQGLFGEELERLPDGSPYGNMVFPMGYGPLIAAHAQADQVDPYLVAALIREESWFNPRAVSPVGAMGLMQVMPETARVLKKGLRRSPDEMPFPGDDPSVALFDPERNIALGVRFLADMLTRFHGEIPLAVAAYNAGPGAVERWRGERPSDPMVVFIESIPYAETRRYVKRVLRNYAEYRRRYVLTGVSEKKYSADKDS
jgi:soluble lytic murein transglycosylase